MRNSLYTQFSLYTLHTSRTLLLLGRSCKKSVMPILTKALSSVLGASWLHKPKLSGSRLALCLTAARNGQHLSANVKSDAKHVCASFSCHSEEDCSAQDCIERFVQSKL